jgi:hypothetical protein
LLVYGDQSIAITCADFVRGLKRRLATDPPSLDAARVWLVLAGQLEQACEDAGLACAAQARMLTDSAAEHFVHRCRTYHGRPELADRMRHHVRVLENTLRFGSPMAHVRTPEGFAWYGLYPEAYAQAADQWAQRTEPARNILVIGIRSIGTTLSAVVAAALALRGVKADRLTVRPGGDHFRRQTSLPAQLPRPDYAIVVDEGPGLSGSSMASVAAALIACGLPHRAITFFPGHHHGPGPEAGCDIRRLWTEIASDCVCWSKLQIAGRPAPRALSEHAGRLLHAPVHLREIGAGKWRQELPRETGPLRSFAPFLEQPKFLATADSDARLLLKFAGFALASSRDAEVSTIVEVQQTRLNRLAEAGFVAEPIGGNVAGWTASPWLEGRRLCVSDADRATIDHIGRYIRAAAGPPLPPAEVERAHLRLSNILVANAGELFGEPAAHSASEISKRVASRMSGQELPSYGDGRLAPHEWVETGGTILKTDAGGHEFDHTAVGLQTIWWDIAGASVEWELSPAATSFLERTVNVACNVQGAYYRATYCAFRAGIAKLGMQSTGSFADHRLFQEALAFYKRRLAAELIAAERET